MSETNESSEIRALFGRARTAWMSHEKARRSGDIRKMKEAYDLTVDILSAISCRGHAEEIKKFLKEEGMPVRALLRKIKGETLR